MHIIVLHFFYEEYILTGKLENILFFHFGQDMLEALFSRVRAMLGSNTSPTAEQLSGILRQLVMYNELKAPERASCQDHLNILYIPSGQQKNVQNFPRVQNVEDELIPNLNIDLNFRDKYTIKIRAGTIEKKIRYGVHHCSHCSTIFSSGSEKIDGVFFETGLAQRPSKVRPTFVK